MSSSAELDESFLASDAALDALLAGFATGTWPIAQWTHAAHLAMAACYLLEDDPTVLDRVRNGICAYNVAQGGENTADKGYHETLTRFWLVIVKSFLGRMPPGIARLEAVRLVVVAYGHRRDLFKDYYSFDVVNSREARAGWVPPERPVPYCFLRNDDGAEILRRNDENP